MNDGVVSSVTNTMDTQTVSTILSRKIIGFKLDLKKELKELGVEGIEDAESIEEIEKAYKVYTEDLETYFE